jgi:hypothetical protein
MPSLRDWRHILAAAAGGALSVTEAGHRFPAYPFSPARPEVLPCLLVQQGGAGGDYVEDTSDLATLCQYQARFTIWLVCGDPLTEHAADLFDRLIEDLHSSTFGERCQADPANPAGFAPAVGAVGTPGQGELGGTPVWWAPVELVCPVHLPPTSTTP